MKFKAVIFDLFGTLIDNFSIDAYRDMVFKMADILDAPREDFIKSWDKTFTERSLGVFRTIKDNIYYICRELGLPEDEEKLSAATVYRCDFMARQVVPRDGVRDTLATLKEKGCKVGLISDCSAEVPGLVAASKLAGLLEKPVFSAEVGLKKPDQRIYLLACERLTVQPQDCLYIGDGSSFELSGAVKAGMQAAMIRVPYEENIAHHIDEDVWEGRVIRDIWEVLGLVE